MLKSHFAAKINIKDFNVRDERWRMSEIGKGEYGCKENLQEEACGCTKIRLKARWRQAYNSLAVLP